MAKNSSGNATSDPVAETATVPMYIYETPLVIDAPSLSDVEKTITAPADTPSEEATSGVSDEVTATLVEGANE